MMWKYNQATIILEAWTAMRTILTPHRAGAIPESPRV
jgi:hypothetical protein